MTRPSSNGYDVTQLSVFDPAGRVVCRSEFAQSPVPCDEQDPTAGAQFVYNDAGWLITSVDPLGHDVDYTYDARGNRRTRTSTPDGTNPATEEWQYDAAGRLTAELDALDQTTTYTWGTDSGPGYGRVATVADPSGRTTAVGYDLVGRTTSEVHTASGLDTISQTYGYDDLGRRTSATRQVGSGGVETQTFGFDLAGNLVSQDGPEPFDSGLGYDPDLVARSWSVTGTPREMTYPNGAKLRWDHDDADRIWRTFLVSGGVSLPMGEYAYHPAGQLKKEHFDGGQIAQRWYHYQNNSDELTYYEQDFASPNNDADIDTDLVYDDAGRLSSECDLDTPASSAKATVCTSANGTLVAYGYDDAGQLADVTRDAVLTDEVTYDWVGGRDTYVRYDPSSGDPDTRDTYTFDAAGALEGIDQQAWGGSAWGTAVGLVDYTIDEAGRRTEADVAGGETWGYLWDAQGRLVERDSTDSDEDETYGYDPAGNLTERTTSSGTGTMVWDNAEPVSRMISQSGLGTVNWGYGIRPLYVSGFGIWLSHDHHGSVLDYASIGLPDDYDPWGNPQGGNPATLNSTLPLYRSEIGIGGLTHLRNRDYDPTTSTFLSRDPLTEGPGSPELGTGIPFEGGLTVEANSHHYVGNDPLNFVDPLGLCRTGDPTFQVGAMVDPSCGGRQVCIGSGAAFPALEQEPPDLIPNVSCWWLAPSFESPRICGVDGQIATERSRNVDEITWGENGECVVSYFSGGGVCIRRPWNWDACGPNSIAEDTNVTAAGCWWVCIGGSVNLAGNGATPVLGFGTPGVSLTANRGQPPGPGAEATGCYWVCSGAGSSGGVLGIGTPGATLTFWPEFSSGGSAGTQTCRPYSPSGEMGGSGCYP